MKTTLLILFAGLLNFANASDLVRYSAGTSCGLYVWMDGQNGFSCFGPNLNR